jgi:FAD/FMN-containing dehydrogenase
MLQVRDTLARASRQLAVVPEIGNATAGSVACCGTKDAALGPAWPGQISSGVIGVRMVDARGDVVEITETDLVPLRAIRSSYGLLGVVFEVTFRTIPRRKLRYTYKSFDLPRGLEPLPDALALEAVRGGASGFLGFLMPYRRKLVVERRTLDPPPAKSPVVAFRDKVRLWARDRAWEHIATTSKLNVEAWTTFDLSRLLPVRYRSNWLETLDPALEAFLARLESFDAWAGSSMIDFERERFAFDFAFWAFPGDAWATALPAYLDFCDAFRRETGFRSALPTEVYFIRQDDSALLSVCPDTDVFTLDLVDVVPRSESDEALWRTMNERFNEFAEGHGARPLLNQTKFLKGPDMARLRSSWRQRWPLIAPRWAAFEEMRRSADPAGRFLTPYFGALLSPGEEPPHAPSA